MTKVLVPNERSRRALERNGYRTVGIHRMHYFTLGQWHDEWLGEVLREDWEREQASLS
jgi:RimJ/RimL family protein N-acetyltransferase